MGRAKDIVVKVLPAKLANDFVRRHHYSGKVVNNSTLHFGAFLDGRLHGVMSFGSPLDKRKVLPLVHTADGVPCLWNEMLELNRMAFDDHLPKNSESRCLSVALRLIRKNAPHIRWILSFSDGTQCGDGSIYRASGFVLTLIKENDRLIVLNGQPSADLIDIVKEYKRFFSVMHPLYFQAGQRQSALQKKFVIEFRKRGGNERRFVSDLGAEYMKGYQLRYIYLLDKTCKLNCHELPFSEIDRIGAGMYRGEKITLAERRNTSVQSIIGDAPGNQSGEGGSIPT